MQLNQNVYLALTDHIDFALRRFKDGMLYEKCALQRNPQILSGRIPDWLSCPRSDRRADQSGELPEDEAASIAFHLVNSEFGGMRLRRYSDYDGDNPVTRSE